MRWQTIRTLLYVLPYLAVAGFFWYDFGGAPPLVSFVSFVLYIGVVGRQWEHIFERVYGIRERDVFRSLLSWGFVLLMLGFGVSTLIIFGTTEPGTMPSAALCVAFFTTIVYQVSARWRSEKGTAGAAIRLGNELAWYAIPRIWLFVPFLLGGAMLYLMIRARSGGGALTPWQILPPEVLTLALCLFVCLGVIILSRTKITRVLTCIIFASIVIHLYLPLSHVLPWGGDVWRHMATEEHIIEEKVYGPVLFGEKVSYKEKYGIQIPEVFFATHKFTYGQLWGLSIFLHQFLAVDLLRINIWLGPILWSILVPILLFRIGAVLFGSWRHGTALAALSLLPFSLQAVGAFTLPVTLGVISFLYGLLFWTIRCRDSSWLQTLIALFWGFLMLFGYVVPAFLWWVMVIGTTLFLTLYRSSSHIAMRIGKILLLPPGILGLLFIFPVIEIFFGLSNWPTTIAFRDVLIRFIGEWSGWYFAEAIRPHDILSGNIFFNHTPLEAYVVSPFSIMRTQVLVCVVSILFLACVGFYQVVRLRLRPWIPLVVMAFPLIGGYILSWYGLQGEHSFVRRFDPFIAVTILSFALAGAVTIGSKIGASFKPFFVPLVLVFLAWVTTTIWQSGPDMRVIPTEALEAARVVADADSSCVLADTWDLLPVEYRTKGRIIGGGFPIDRLFGQEELGAFYEAITATSTPHVVYNETTAFMNGEECALLLPKTKVTPLSRTDLTNTLGDPQEIGPYLLWLAPKSGL